MLQEKKPYLIDAIAGNSLLFVSMDEHLYKRKKPSTTQS